MEMAKKSGLGMALITGLTVSGCGELGTLGEVLSNPVVRQLASLTLAGVTPAADYRETGNINFSVLPGDAEGSVLQLANLQESGMKVEVQNEDGSYSECEHSGGEVVEPHELSAMTLLLDGSGSMELAYPPSEYGEVCVTCPHDPTRERIVAAHGLIDRVSEVSPQTKMALAEFGPEPSAGFTVTRLHSDFTVDPQTLGAGLDAVGGHERVGTPLYDSLAEMIGETREAAKAMETKLRTERGDDVSWEASEPGADPDEASDVPAEEREVARYIIVLSDGIDTESTVHDLASVTDLAQASGVAVYAVGLGPASASSADPDQFEPGQTQAVRDLQKLARDTGGFYAAAKNPAQLSDLYDAVARALTEGYTVETYSCIPKPTAETPEEDCTCHVPAVGSRIDGRVSMGDLTIPWVTIAN